MTRARTTNSSAIPWTCCGTRTSTGSSPRRISICCGIDVARVYAATSEPRSVAGRRRAGSRDRPEPTIHILEDDSHPPRRTRAMDPSLDPPECVAAHRRFLLSTSDAFSQTWRRAWLNDLTLYGPAATVRDDIPGTLDFEMAAWMMRAEVRAALHVESSPATSWPGPSDDWTYESQWAACTTPRPRGRPPWLIFTVISRRGSGPRSCLTATRTRACRTRARGRRSRLWVCLESRGAGSVPIFNVGDARLRAGGETSALRAGPRGGGRGAQFGGHVTSYAGDSRSSPCTAADTWCRSSDPGSGCICSGNSSRAEPPPPGADGRRARG